MPTFEVEPGVRIAYQDRGTGRPIVFVHGWAGAGDAWDLQVLDLADRYRCITVDLRGHGDSDKPWGRYDYPMFCRDLRALMTGLDLSDVTLVGWSMGGHLGLKYVATIGAPVTRLVITNSGPRFHAADDVPFGTPPAEVQGLVDAIRHARTETVVGLYGNNFHRTDLTATRDWFIQMGWRVPAFVGLTSFESLLAEDVRADLPRIEIPVAVFAGRHDKVWDPRWSEVVADGVPGARLTYFENSGHVAFIEDRVDWNEALTKFIDAT
ncbi:alpha/beta fold hydrolase [Virgisporangium aurantiacum]|uniref:AB hydrolase superfamily protein YisY n=1 Tax=Virgisporangium aurantiacum TaxID=175570 RepID=A0A8J4E5D1_9ACTN|nr:alpha/beta hydrolase [Virgisporangium aurantiacum]GIJ62156.1 AB hydrolase superfamily protein YisY [Virgisporangium aurantiacum]